MSDLVEFAKRIKQQLSLSDRDPHWGPGEAESYMAEVGVRSKRFEEIAVRLNDTVIQPRLETLAGYFSNASLTRNEPAGHCACWFGYCERFPSSTKAAFAVEHDVRFENVLVCYEASMMPVFIKFSEHDRLTLPLEDVADERVAVWIEKRLLEFLDAYLRIDRGGEQLEDEVAADPVCGMRISRFSAAASDGYKGHPYYFCSTACHEKFARQPSAYVQVKAM